MKKGVWFVFAFSFLLLTAMGFVSSQGLSELLNSIPQDLVILLVVFLVSFAILFFALNRFFKNNSAIAGIISIAISFLIAYGVNTSGLDIQGFLLSIGLTQDVLGILLPLAIIAGLVLATIKLKDKKNILWIVGILFILASFFVYYNGILLVIGIVLIIVRLFLGAKQEGYFGRGGGSAYWRQRGSGAGTGGLMRVLFGRGGTKGFNDYGAGI